MSRVTLTLRPPGRGGWSPIVLTFDAARRGELPLPVAIRRGDLWPINGQAYRVSRIRVQG